MHGRAVRGAEKSGVTAPPSPLCIGTVEGATLHGGCAAAHLLLDAGLEVNMKLVSRADVRHLAVVFMLKTLEICKSK